MFSNPIFDRERKDKKVKKLMDIKSRNKWWIAKKETEVNKKSSYENKREERKGQKERLKHNEREVSDIRN